jgi:hypothetical protein
MFQASDFKPFLRGGDGTVHRRRLKPGAVPRPDANRTELPFILPLPHQPVVVPSWHLPQQVQQQQEQQQSVIEPSQQQGREQKNLPFILPKWHLPEKQQPQQEQPVNVLPSSPQQQQQQPVILPACTLPQQQQQQQQPAILPQQVPSCTPPQQVKEKQPVILPSCPLLCIW